MFCGASLKLLPSFFFDDIRFQVTARHRLSPLSMKIYRNDCKRSQLCSFSHYDKRIMGVVDRGMNGVL